MWQRIKTAIILVIIVGVAMFASHSPILFVPLLALGVIIASHEWTKLMPKWRVPLWYVMLVLAITMLTLYFPMTWVLWGLAIVIWLMVAWVRKFPETNWYGRRLSLMGVVILTASITMFYLWQTSPWWLLYVFVLVWCAHGGVLAGRAFGT